MQRSKEGQGILFFYSLVYSLETDSLNKPEALFFFWLAASML